MLQHVQWLAGVVVPVVDRADGFGGTNGGLIQLLVPLADPNQGAALRRTDPRFLAVDRVSDVCSPSITVCRNSRARLASTSKPSGFDGRGTTGAKIFSQQSGIFSPVNATG